MRPLLRLRGPILSVVLVAILAGGFASACTVYNRLQVEPAELGAERTGIETIDSPVKAHLVDGTTIVYRDGAVLTRDSLFPRSDVGGRFGLTLARLGPPTPVPLDSVAGLEAYRASVNAPATVLFTAGGIAVGAVAAGALAVAIFGSCPTFYAPSGSGEFALEAEGFSYSIAPLFESRDVDLLRARPDAEGRLWLEVRNEALETHFINHLELVRVQRRPEERAVPDTEGRAVALAGLRRPGGARDRTGRDVSDLLRDEDGAVFASDPAVLAGVSEDDLRDWIDLSFPAPAVDSAAVVLRLRNSLLTTVLLYDVMLTGSGALDWLGRELNTVAGAVAVGRWYRERMGLRVAVLDGGAYREVARVSSAGPIAWEEVAAVVPVLEEDSLRLRLSFVADEWRLDRVALAGKVRRPEERRIAPVRIVDAAGASDEAALGAVRSPDEHYLETRPMQRFRLEFETAPGPAPVDYFLATQGYYTEWVRPAWIRGGRRDRFEPTDAALVEALRLWRDRQETLETRFYASRLPVR